MERQKDDNDRKEELRTKLIDSLSQMLTGYSDEIPEEMVHGTALFKVQSNWFGPTMSWIQTALTKFPNQELETERQSFWQKYEQRNQDFYQAQREGKTTEKARRHTKEEVEEANGLLIKVINHLKTST